MESVREEIIYLRMRMSSWQKYWLSFSWALTFCFLLLAVSESLGMIEWIKVQTAWLLEDVTLSVAMATSIPILSQNLDMNHRKLLRNTKRRFEGPIETSYLEADKGFQRINEKELERVGRKSKQIQEDIQNALEDLDESLEEIEGFDDYKDRQVIEDVMDNIAFRRRKLIEKMDVPKEPVQLHKNLEEFVEEFQDMSQKEEAVIDEAVIPDEFQDSLKKLELYRKQLERFLESDYDMIETKKELENNVSELQNKKSELEKLSEKIQNLDLEDAEKTFKELETQLDQFETTSTWSEYQELKQRKEELGSERKQILSELGSALNKTERGLKKLLYQIENSNIDAEIDKEILREVKNSDKEELLKRQSEEVEECLKSVIEILPEDLLQERQERKLIEGCKTLIDSFSEKKDRVNELNQRIDSVENEINSHDAPEKKQELKDKKKEMQDELNELESSKQEIKGQIEDKEKEIERTKSEIENLLKSSISRKVELE